MAKKPIDTTFEDACYGSGSAAAEGSTVTGTFPGMKGETPGAVDQVILVYTDVEAPTGGRNGLLGGGD